jgi:hypothetical protein
MKKTIVLVTITFLLTANSSSFAQRFDNGDNLISLGIGLGSSFGGYTYSSQTPAISVQFEHGNWDVGGPGVISLGGYLGFKSFSYDGFSPGYSYSETWDYTVIGLRSAYHYNGIHNKDFDVYGGLMLSYNMANYQFSSSNPAYDYLYQGDYGNGFTLSLYLSGRYYFTDNVSGFLELGYGISNFTIGASFKLSGNINK